MKASTRTLNLFGMEVELTVKPRAFVRDLKRLSQLLDENQLEAFFAAMRQAEEKWGYDAPDFARYRTLAAFLKEP